MGAREEVLALIDRDGRALPETVLQVAEDTASALHSLFEWDDTEAGHRYRLIQAGHIIRRVTMTVTQAPDKTIRVRQLISVPGDDGRPEYVLTADALRNPQTHDYVIAQARREIEALRRKYQNLIDFDDLLADVLRRKESAAS